MPRRHFEYILVTMILFLTSACSLPGRSSSPSAVAQTQSFPTGSDIPLIPSTNPPASETTISPTLTGVPIDLSHQPLYWFGPLPPLSTNPGRPFTGSDDFMQLFTPDAAWTEAASHLQVFKLYGEWVAYQATDAQLRQVVTDLRRRGLALAIEEGPLNASTSCARESRVLQAPRRDETSPNASDPPEEPST